ncbi:M23 family metallopeptidase [Streptomyces sp. NPDC055210]
MIAVITAGTATALTFPSTESTTSNSPLPPASTSFPPFPTRDVVPPEDTKEQPDGGVIIAPGQEGSSDASPSSENAAEFPSVDSPSPSRASQNPSTPPGRSAKDGSFVPPVTGYVVTARYSQQGNWTTGHHTGIDLAVPVGTLVRSTSSGTVIVAGSDPRYGNYAVVRRSASENMLYAHLSKLSVQSGTSVAGGDELGLSGATGNVTGPHLHFEVRTEPVFGSDIDPVAYLAKHGVNL